MEITFKRDTPLRKLTFTPNSFAHPAKMDAQLLIWLVEKYTVPGDVILDCMAGSGTTLLACSLGRHVVTVELEQKFVEMQKGNWQKIRERGPQMGYQMGTATILQGDARNLGGLLVDKIISSPPYENSLDENSHSPAADKLYKEKGLGGYTDKVDKCIFSPPYENTDKIGREHGGIVGREMARGNHNGDLGNPTLYSRDSDNIGNLKSDSYLEAMLQVYQQCFSVLKPHGLMVLVLKNFVRDRKVVRLDLDTVTICEKAGFIFQERHFRKLTTQSFWRTIYYQKYPTVERIDKEDILVFRKGDEL